MDLVRASPPLIDYVICHELTHGFYPDHGKDWRGLLSTVMPDWEAGRPLLSPPCAKNWVHSHLRPAGEWRRRATQSTDDADRHSADARIVRLLFVKQQLNDVAWARNAMSLAFSK